MSYPLVMPRSVPKRAFTLIELLTALVIISILASLAVVAGRHAVKSAKQSAAFSNFREVHRAILLYAAEHRDQLPGPSSVAIYPWVTPTPRPTDTAHLGTFLAPYLNSPPTAGLGQRVFLDVLRVPGSPLEDDDDMQPASLVKLDAPISSEDNVWGILAVTFSQSENATVRPKRIGELTHRARRTSIITTADRQTWSSPHNVRLPDTGVFDGKRLHLFIDGSIALSPAGRLIR